MTKFIALDMENADEVKLNAILFSLKAGVPEKLDELHLTIKSEKKFNGGVTEAMNLFCELDDESADKFWAFIENTNILLTANSCLTPATALYCGCFKENPIVIGVTEMAKSLNFEMEHGENKCEIIMNTFASIWEKQTFVCAPYI